MQGMYFTYTHLTRKNMKIYLVLTFLNNLLPLVFNKSKSFWNSTIFLGLWEKKYKLYKIYSNQHITFSFDKLTIIKKTLWPE
jgi:hypothetical protein